MKALCVVVFCCLPLGGAPAPVIRAAIATPSPITVGQAVRLDVTVLVPNYFTGQPEFPLFDLDDAIVVLPEDRPRNSSEVMNGQTYAGIGVTYRLYPQRSGVFELPQFEILFRYAAEPPKSLEIRLRVPLVRFAAGIPPQAADLEYFLPTTKLSIRQTFDKPLKTLKVGDTFTRTVTVSVDRLHAMLIPPTRFQTKAGINVYPKQPVVEDRKDERGEFRQGRRVDAATYVLQKQGAYALPEIDVTWWDLTAHRVRIARLPTVQFVAEANSRAHPEIAPEPDPTAIVPARRKRTPHIRQVIIALALLLPLIGTIWLARCILPRLRRQMAEWRRAADDSETASFKRLQASCRRNSSAETYTLLLAWLHRARPAIPLSRFLDEVKEPELQLEVDLLTAGLYREGAEEKWSGERLGALLRLVRNREHAARVHVSALPPLNPGMN